MCPKRQSSIFYNVKTLESVTKKVITSVMLVNFKNSNGIIKLLVYAIV